jgi:putative endonuclease
MEGHRTEKQMRGAWGEEQAALFLLRHGYEVVERNYQCRMGELDIVAWQTVRTARTLCFVEVKTRGYGTGSAERATQGPKLPRIFSAARHYCVSHGIDINTTPIQFEHVSVYPNKRTGKVLIRKYAIPVN